MSATIQSKHNLGSEPVGNVIVTYADGTTDLWTLKGNCKLPKVSPQGEIARAAHGAAIIELFSVQHSSAEASVEAFREDLPGWAQPFHD